MITRIIGRYEGEEKGPLLICIGGMHGNEPAGVRGIEEAFRLLDKEPEANPAFRYSGACVGIRGNLSALKENTRFINRDLNRMLADGILLGIRNTSVDLWSPEDKESVALVETIEREIKHYSPEFTLILDFHTTSVDGGIFTISSDDPTSRQLALGLHAPVILGVAEGLIGTTIEYFHRPSSNCYCIVFEAGQHDDPGCEHRCVAAIINCMRSIGAVKPGDVDHRHDGLLIRLSQGLPKMSRLIYHYKIQPGENFVMKPGFKNFQQIFKGEELAKNESGIIYSPRSGMILMPKYQSQGEDGFFIVEVIEK